MTAFLTKTFYTLLAALIGLAVIRLIPVDTEAFHEDPALPEKRRSEVRLIGREAPRYPVEADELLAAFQRIATADFSTRLVEGSVEEGMMTFVSRSPVFGFRDFTTVKAVDEAGGAKLSLFARPRGNVYDWGMNEKRSDRWLGELQETLGGA